MIKVIVIYPYNDGSRFDHTYYRDRHMPLVAERLGDVCHYYTIDKGLFGRGADDRPAFEAMCAFICRSVDDYEAVMREHGHEIRSDIVNYTDIKPLIQFSEVIVERSDC